MCCSQIEDLERAYHYLKLAFLISGMQHAGCAYRLGVVCVDTKRYPEGLGYLDLTTQMMQPDTTIMKAITLAKGEGYYLSQHYEEAVRAWKEHLKYNPSSVVRRFDSGYADKVFKTLEKVSADISAAGLAQHFSQVYEAYCCDRLLLLIMNYICNPNAELSYTQRRGLFNEVVGREPIASALKNSDLSKMSRARQIMLHFARGMNFSVVAFIASVRNIQRKILM